MSLNIADILEKYPHLAALRSGRDDATVGGLNDPVLAEANELIFVNDEKYLSQLGQTRSEVWVVHKKFLEKLNLSPKRALIESSNPQLLMSYLGRDFFAHTSFKTSYLSTQNIHPMAFVHETARIAEGTVIGPFTTIGENVIIGSNCIIGPNTTIESSCKIGDQSHIHAQVYLGFGTQIGRRCEVHPQSSIGTEGYGYAHDERGQHHRIRHLGKVVLEDDVHIGAGVQIDRGTFGESRIGEGTKIDNHCHFGHNIHIGKHCLITGGLIAAGSVKIGDHCVFGGRTTVTGHIEIGDHCHFAGLSGVSKSVEGPGAFGGYPLQPLKRALKTTATLGQIIELKKTVKELIGQMAQFKNNSAKQETK